MERSVSPRKRECQWFVEPKSAHTNQVIVAELAAMIDVSENREMLDAAGQSHHVYRVSEYKFITELNKAKFKFSLDFIVFSRQGNNGPIREWKFGTLERHQVERTASILVDLARVIERTQLKK
jgi:hypothetical protein